MVQKKGKHTHSGKKLQILLLTNELKLRKNGLKVIQFDSAH